MGHFIIVRNQTLWSFIFMFVIEEKLCGPASYYEKHPKLAVFASWCRGLWKWEDCNFQKKMFFGHVWQSSELDCYRYHPPHRTALPHRHAICRGVSEHAQSGLHRVHQHFPVCVGKRDRVSSWRKKMHALQDHFQKCFTTFKNFIKFRWNKTWSCKCDTCIKEN